MTDKKKLEHYQWYSKIKFIQKINTRGNVLLDNLIVKKFVRLFLRPVSTPSRLDVICAPSMHFYVILLIASVVDFSVNISIALSA